MKIDWLIDYLFSYFLLVQTITTIIIKVTLQNKAVYEVRIYAFQSTHYYKHENLQYATYREKRL